MCQLGTPGAPPPGTPPFVKPGDDSVSPQTPVAASLNKKGGTNRGVSAGEGAAEGAASGIAGGPAGIAIGALTGLMKGLLSGGHTKAPISPIETPKLNIGGGATAPSTPTPTIQPNASPSIAKTLASGALDVGSTLAQSKLAKDKGENTQSQQQQQMMQRLMALMKPPQQQQSDPNNM